MGGKGFLAICSDKTEKECFDKMLFGSLAKWTTEVAKVQKGDIGFLRNYESKKLFGVFRAESNGLLNIDKNAWGGRFPAQVKVAWVKQYAPLQNADALLWSLGINPAKYILTLDEIAIITGLLMTPEQVISVTPYGQTEQPRFKTEDGHLVRSKSEALIDNWFYNNGIVHAYESRVPIQEDMECDFYVPSVGKYVEYWGREDQEEYRKRMDKKRSRYSKNHLDLVELREKDMQKLSDILGKHFGELIKRRKGEQVIRKSIDSEFVLSDMQWTILEAAQGAFGNATSTMELAKTTGLDNAAVYRECVILRDTGYVGFTDDSHGMAMLKITGPGLLALRERDRLTMAIN